MGAVLGRVVAGQGLLLPQVRTPIDEVQERFLAVLSEHERAVLMELLVRLLERSDKLGDVSGETDRDAR
jgi:DNA-binding MarR family transcriptional regulator